MDPATTQPPTGATTHREGDVTVTTLNGGWRDEAQLPSSADLLAAFDAHGGETWQWRPGNHFAWDSRLLARLLPVARHCHARGVKLDLAALPAAVGSLLQLALAVPALRETQTRRARWHGALPRGWRHLVGHVRSMAEFVGDTTLALIRFLAGRADTRGQDIVHFMSLSGPQAVAIVALISVLVGMILAYLGSVQLRQFGAQIFVADLVAVGMVREMGALMTAVIMAGRTGAAYAAQLGAMQANEEIDAITTLGISPVEYLVLPRMLALVAVMPLLTVFSVALGMGGGALVAAGMDVSLVQFITQARDALGLSDLASGILKSVLFGLLIAVAGCRAGLQSGRSSAAVGQATTSAVVHAIVYLVVADAGLNILYDELGI